MLDWFLRTDKAGPPVENDPVKAISRELGKSPELIDPSAVVPVLVPSAFSELGNWPGPIYHLAAQGFDQTWAVKGPDDVIVYVSRPMQAFWDQAGIDWQDRAARNLRALAEAEPCSHSFFRDDGTSFMVAMLFGGGLGPSRLLVPDLFAATFPEGYGVAVPEMTCGVAFTATPTSAEKLSIDEFIEGCFERGSEPVSAAQIDPTKLWQIASDDLGLRA